MSQEGQLSRLVALMRQFLKRLTMGIAVFVVLGVSAVAIAIRVRENRTFDAPYPDIHAGTDPAVIARGRYLVTCASYCTACHGQLDPEIAGISQMRERPFLIGQT